MLPFLFESVSNVCFAAVRTRDLQAVCFLQVGLWIASDWHHVIVSPRLGFASRNANHVFQFLYGGESYCVCAIPLRVVGIEIRAFQCAVGGRPAEFDRLGFATGLKQEFRWRIVMRVETNSCRV
ncbi:hypothetical protein WJ70_03000 [Burkholderia ubonensis]|nr:hypothetical protein WJ70_03000 [Burkholderia ubonensis]